MYTVTKKYAGGKCDLCLGTRNIGLLSILVFAMPVTGPDTNSSCDDFSKIPLVILVSTNGIACFVCLMAAILVFIMKLHNKPIYRLALYQVLAGLALAAAFLGQIFLIKHSKLSTEDADGYENLCVAFAFLLLYAEWVKLVLTVWLTVHIFCFAVFLKNLKKFEPLYVVTSLLVPAGIALVPLLTKTYGLAGSWCWIADWKNNCDANPLVEGATEQFALWYGPAMVLLGLSATAMITMVTVMACRICMHSTTTFARDNNWKALKQLLPLAIYPMLFLFFITTPFINRLYGIWHSVPQKTRYDLSISHAVSAACWNLSTGLVFVVHVVATGMCSKKMCIKRVSFMIRADCKPQASINYVPVSMDPNPTSKISTWFSLPKPSV